MKIKSQIITEELLANMVNKNYWNGEEIKIGDKMIFAFLIDNWQSIEKIDLENIPITREAQTHEIKTEMIILKEEHLELFDLMPFSQNSNTILCLTKKS